MPSIYSNHLLDNDNNYQRAKPLNDNGILPYDSNLDYAQANGTLVKGSNNNVYQAMQDNGPSSAVVDPVGDNSGVWELAYFSPKNPQPKNYIVNSDMAVSQENGDGPITIPSGGTLYGRDQFSTAQSSGVTGAVTFEKGSIGNFDSYKITATSAISGITGGNEAARIAQPIESASVKVLNGETITISFKARTNWSGNLSVNLGNSDLTRSYAEIYPVVSGVNDVTVTIPAESNTFGTGGNGLGAVLWVGLNNEGSFAAASTGSWLSGDLRTSTSATQWAKTTGNFVEITEVQLVEGNVAPKYQPYTDAFYNSYRYYRKGRFNRRGAALGSGRWQELIYLGHDLRAAGICNLSAISTSGGFVGSNPTLSSLIADLSSLEVSTDFLTPSTADNTLAFEWEVISRL